MSYPVNIPICMRTRTVSDMLKHRFARVRAGLETPLEFLALCFDRAMNRYAGHRTHTRMKLYAKRMRKRMRALNYERNGFFDFNGIKIPMLNDDMLREFFNQSFDDDYYIYLFVNDNYDEAVSDKYFYLLIEGPFCMKNDSVDVRVQPGDVVIDAGSWIGDFAAYASVKGATTYAFEPSKELFTILERTAELNGGIIPVQKALSDESSSDTRIGGVFNKSLGDTFDVTTIDDFVRENNIPRVDFIKSDIEGFERKLLAGAQETLSRFAPKLALCTYHLPDDPQVMAELILKANPKYNIVQKRMKLFASVPK